jgi:methyl-accepting chemotaxis protein
MNLTALMRSFSIRTRMYSAIAIVLGLILLVGGVGLYGLVHNQQANDDYMAASFSEVGELSKMRETLGHIRIHERSVLLASGQADTVDKEAQGWHTAITQFREQCAKMLEGDEDEDNPIVRKVLADLDNYQKAVEAELPALRDGSLTGQAALSKLAAPLVLATALDAAMQAIDKVMSAESATAQALQADNVKLTVWVFAGAVLLAIAVVAPTTIINQICICRPLDEAEQLAAAIAQGRLDNRVDVRGSDEPARLLSALDHMQHALRSMVKDVRVSAESISTASSEIASGNMDLSARTETTASSLQETASSMEQLTATVKQRVQANKGAALLWWPARCARWPSAAPPPRAKSSS